MLAAWTVQAESAERDPTEACHARKLKKSSQPITTKPAEHGQLFCSRQQKRPYLLTRPTQQLQRGKSRKRHLVDIPETRQPQALLKYFPSKRPQRIARVNRNEGKN